MQEITVKQRSSFKHYFTIDSPGKELCWDFFTRKKNISFGLFRKDDSNSRASISMMNELESIPNSPLVSSISTTSHLRNKSSVSVESLNETQTRTSISKSRATYPGLIPLLPIEHYASSKGNVTGSYVVVEPGTFVLVFDNTYSVKTPKKLFFNVHARDAQTHVVVLEKKEVEGWLLKKGNRTVQGYSRRWVVVNTSGVLTYSKTEGGRIQGSVDLTANCAIRIHHDHRLIDIDSSQSTFHFKVELPEEFDRWLRLFQKFDVNQLTSQLERHTSLIITRNNDSILRGSSVKEAIPNGTTEVALESVQQKATEIFTTLQQELIKMKSLIDSSKGRINSKSQWKDFAEILNSVSDMTSGLVNNASSTQLQLQILNASTRAQKEKAIYSLQNLDAAFYACLNDNNRIRKKFGLDLVPASAFLAEAENHQEVVSINTPDVFYDAEEGEYSDDSSDGFSVHDTNEHLIIEEESDTETNGISVDVSKAGSLYSSVIEEKSSVSLESTAKVSNSPMQVVRRTALPCPASSMENISIMGILRNNVGKDLSTVAMPIALNEPINLLQKLAEELEYSSLLDAASKTHDPVERLCLMAGFVVSGYSSTVHRSARKPFNPLLGETYEFDRPDLGFKFLAEKVSHHPAIMACHAISPNYIFYQDSLLKTKFWGKSMELNNIGTVNVQFPALEEHYVWQKLTTSMRNMFSSSRSLEHHGTIKIISKLTGHYCELNFKESGYFSSANNEVEGAIYAPNAKKMISVGGRWDHSINKYSDSSPNKLEVIWRANPFPANHVENYGFTQFAIELNELTPDLEDRLPNTDTRYRTDQRLYEDGRSDDAEAEKLRLEQKQRDFRKENDTPTNPWSPQYFKLVESKDSESGSCWTYNGTYWESNGKFQNYIDLYS